MKKKEIIREIENLFPIDSGWEDTNATGRNLLMETIEGLGWRNLPKKFLKVYLQKCVQMDDINVNKAVKQHNK